MRTTIGERVRTYRLRRGLTQARLAHLIGRSERWLIDVEHGGVDPRLSDALALARVLNVAVDDLAGVTTPTAERTGRPPPRPPVRTYYGEHSAWLPVAVARRPLLRTARGTSCVCIDGGRGWIHRIARDR